MDQLMSVTELAKYLKVNKQTIYNWVNKKEIPFTKIGDLLRFDKDEIERWLKNKTFRPDIIEYNGYEIQASPYQLAESKNWTINIYIFKHRGSYVASKNFSLANSYPSREEAVRYCFDFGKKIIDDRIKDFSVGGL